MLKLISNKEMDEIMQIGGTVMDYCHEIAHAQLEADRKVIFERLFPFAFLGDGYWMLVIGPEEYRQLRENK